MLTWKNRLRHLLIALEPALPASILDAQAERFRSLPTNATICIKVSCAYDLPYPFAVSGGFVAQVVREIHQANTGLNIVLTEGGVGAQSVCGMASRHGLDRIDNARFVDAESSEAIYTPNPNPTPFREAGFYLPACWVTADMRILLTTCKLRSHHFQRWYSGGTRNLIGLLPRGHYKLSTSKREMRSELHQRGIDAMVADLYATTGKNTFTILDARLIARQDEHFPIRFTRNLNQIVVANDPAEADEQVVDALKLPFTPPYLAMIAKARAISKAS